MEESETAEAVEESAPSRFRINWILVLGIVVGLQFLLIAAGGIILLQRNKTLEKELSTVKKVLKEKSSEHDYLHEQLESLSKQVSLLKEHSVATSNETLPAKERQESPVQGSDPKPAVAPVADKGKPVVMAAPVPVVPRVPAAPVAPVAPATPVASTTPSVSPASQIPPKLARPKPEGQSCDLMGKSAEEQAATLKRCVGAMDTARGKTATK